MGMVWRSERVGKNEIPKMSVPKFQHILLKVFTLFDDCVYSIHCLSYTDMGSFYTVETLWFLTGPTSVCFGPVNFSFSLFRLHFDLFQHYCQVLHVLCRFLCSCFDCFYFYAVYNNFYIGINSFFLVVMLVFHSTSSFIHIKGNNNINIALMHQSCTITL